MKAETDKLHDAIAGVIQQIRDRREQVKDSARPGQKVRRSAFFSLEEMGLLEPAAIMAEYEKMATRQCRLSASCRRLIAAIMSEAVYNLTKTDTEKK